MDNGITPVMNVGGYGDGCGLNGFGGIFGLLVLLGILNGGGGFFGNGGNGNANAIQAQTRDILGALNTRAAEAIDSINRVYHDVVAYVGDKYMELQRDIGGLAVGQANILAKQQECCCTQLRAIDGVNFNAEKNKAEIKEAILLDGQKTRDLITANKMEQMAARIQQLELAQAVSGVVRYPMQTTYNSGANPFCACGCGA